MQRALVLGCWTLAERGQIPVLGRRSGWTAHSLVGSWHRPEPPALLGLAELARLRGQAWPAVCPGLSASKEGGGSCNDGGGGALPGRSRAGVVEARPDVRSGLGECAGPRGAESEYAHSHTQGRGSESPKREKNDC